MSELSLVEFEMEDETIKSVLDHVFNEHVKYKDQLENMRDELKETVPGSFDYRALACAIGDLILADMIVGGLELQKEQESNVPTE